MILGATGDLAQRELGDAVGIDPRNLVPILDGLEEQGLVTRGEHRSDRRRHAIRLTAAGRTLLTRLRSIGAKAEAALLQPLNRSERRQLHALLTRLL
jgi:DNA-binding MarR family transcriptional regulator